MFNEKIHKICVCNFVNEKKRGFLIYVLTSFTNIEEQLNFDYNPIMLGYDDEIKLYGNYTYTNFGSYVNSIFFFVCLIFVKTTIMILSNFPSLGFSVWVHYLSPFSIDPHQRRDCSYFPAKRQSVLNKKCLAFSLVRGKQAFLGACM